MFFYFQHTTICHSPDLLVLVLLSDIVNLTVCFTNERNDGARNAVALSLFKWVCYASIIFKVIQCQISVGRTDILYPNLRFCSGQARYSTVSGYVPRRARRSSISLTMLRWRNRRPFVTRWVVIVAIIYFLIIISFILLYKKRCSSSVSVPWFQGFTVD